MSSAEPRGTRASSAARAAGRYQDADAASITDIDENVEDRDDGVDSDLEGAGALRPTVAETKQQAPRAVSQGRQPSLTAAGVSSGRSNMVALRRDSGEDSPWRETQPLEGTGTSAALGLQTTPSLAPFLQHSTGSSSTNRRHPNGLPARQPGGPIPGMSYFSELAARYPVRQAPASGPQIALVSGQLYVSDRLREAMSSSKKAPATGMQGAPASGAVAAGAYPTPDLLIPTYVSDGPFPTSSYMQQRRTEKEQRAFYTGQNQPSAAGRPTWPSDAAGPGPSSAGRAVSATTGASAKNGAAGAGAAAPAATASSARQRDIREGVERWLETQGCTSTDAEGARPPAQPDTSNDPSLVYRQYGIFRTYGKQHMQHLNQQQQSPSKGLWPTLSMSAHQRGGHRVAFEQKRASSGAGGGTSPKRPSSQPAAWPPSRQSGW